jgi:hypothetical protein
MNYKYFNFTGACPRQPPILQKNTMFFLSLISAFYHSFLLFITHFCFLSLISAFYHSFLDELIYPLLHYSVKKSVCVLIIFLFFCLFVRCYCCIFFMFYFLFLFEEQTLFSFSTYQHKCVC